MPLQVICPGCKKPLQLPDGSQGKHVRCPMCQVIFAVGPVRSPAAPAPPAAPPARPAPPKAAAPVAAAHPPPPRPRKTEEADDEDRPPPRSRPKREAVERPREDELGPPLQIVLTVGHDPDGEMRGNYSGELSERGLRLRQGDDTIRLRIGSPVKHRRRNQIELKIDGRPVQFLVRGFVTGAPGVPRFLPGLRVNQHRLAADVAAFLRGDREEPLKVEDYLLPWYLFVPVVLPLGLPIVTLGGILPVVAAILLSGACFAVVQRDRWPVFLRLALSLGVSVAGYGAVIGVVALMALRTGPEFGYTDKPTLPEKDWQTYRSADGDFEVLLPGKPQALTDPYPGVQVVIERPEITFRVHHFTVEPDRQLDLTDFDARVRAFQVWPEMSREVLRERPQARLGEYAGAPSRLLPCSFELIDPNPKRSRILIDCHFGRFDDRVYCATIITPHTAELGYDVRKFLDSIRVTYPK
jgi:LSD1 subclass zinc finger protein